MTTLDSSPILRRVYADFLYGYGGPSDPSDWGVDLGRATRYSRRGPVYRQHFERGIAVANVGLSPVEVPLDGRYRDLDGVLCRTAVVPPRSAAVYVAVPDVIPSPRHVGSA
jgi:hypothetical protein